MSYDVTVNRKKITAIVVIAIIVAVSALVFSSSIKIVESGHRGVLLHWSEVDGLDCDPKTGECKALRPPLAEGLHFVVPIQDDVVDIEIRTKKFEKKATSASQDLQDVSTTVTLNYHLEPELVHKLYREIGLDYEDRIINPAVDETVKQVTAMYNAEELVTKRPQVKNDIEELLQQRLANFSIRQDVVSITDFRFSDQFSSAIDAKVTAEQQALEQENKIRVEEAIAQQREAQATGTKLAAIQTAEGERQKRILEAQGKADAIRIEAEAERERIEMISAMLKNNPEYLEWARILQWNGVLPETLLTGDGKVGTLIEIPNKVTQEIKSDQ